MVYLCLIRSGFRYRLDKHTPAGVLPAYLDRIDFYTVHVLRGVLLNFIEVKIPLQKWVYLPTINYTSNVQ